MSEEELIKDIKETKYNEENVEKLLYELENDTGNYSCYDNAIAIIYYKDLYQKEKEIWEETENDYEHELTRKDEKIEKQQKEIETLKESQLVLYDKEGNIIACIKLGKDVVGKEKIRNLFDITINEFIDKEDFIVKILKQLRQELLGE